ncbi:fasciclin domain-containing protein [Nocardioides sp. WL0053]|uniref:Fasciclin domain-containing protein n=1 Tax=Nocardioides jiangsuensis TaxID=2866161 RepID=A0ABS7RGV2_9ACTN|nr:fasciclin domain-containing protein [Nocardioides jiangsuensis]MBY9074270.1 fasciclin domain-containing protein [Nocardioides jiangsuensis]
MRSIKNAAIAVAAVSALSLTAACGADEGAAETSSGSSSSTTEETPMESPMEEPMEEEAESGTDPAANLVGPGCEDYAKAVPDGAGSVAGMAEDPVAVAASNNPLLKTLTASVSGKLNPDVNLVDTLNGDEFTVFAPVDDAFAKLPAKTVKSLSEPKNADTLSTVLTYHVVPGQIAPDQITGMQTTVQGDKVEVTGEGDNLKVNDANVICGGVQTANATVYLIDSVLMPQM